MYCKFCENVAVPDGKNVCTVHQGKGNREFRQNSPSLSAADRAYIRKSNIKLVSKKKAKLLIPVGKSDDE